MPNVLYEYLIYFMNIVNKSYLKRRVTYHINIAFYKKCHSE